MTIKITITEKEGIVYVTAIGEHTIDSAKSTFLEMIDYLQDRPNSKVLIDCTGIFRSTRQTMDDYEYSNFAADQNQKNLSSIGYTKLAYLLPPERIADADFSRSVALNRGLNGEVFDNKEAAITWLNK